MTTQEQLALRCEEVEKAARGALDWVNDPENEETVDLKRKSLVQKLRRGARRATKLSRSARTKMSVSVFGPSQAGKSFLVSVLARPENGQLSADFNGPGGQLDYISEINPAGDGESTGLVTRFTMSKDATPDGFPIKLNLLTEADIARVIINAFYKDGDQSETPPEGNDLASHIKSHEDKAGAGDVPGLSFEEVFEIAEYIENTFGKAAYAAAMKGFYEDAATLAPRMSIPDRGSFLSILWGGYQPLTDLYVQLASALAQIDHAEEVFAPLSSLTPRDTSIIDVKTLHGLFASGSSDTLLLRTAAGKEAHLSRAIVCALAAELVFPMLEQPSPLFSETDLLDFPGARNRFEQPLTKTLETPEETVTQMLLRGKVAYLFDRYVENQEITSMLLCVPDSNMETLDLPPLVDHWIGMTHGTTPKQRAATDCILFFVLTKFDKHLGESASGGTASERFERRMNASLLEGFGKLQSSWVHEWTNGEPFKNCYWLRNPNYFVEGLIDYDDQSREIGIREEKAARVAELRDGCISTPTVIDHFKEPERAWDAALKLNDGGVGYLTEELSKVCKPASKINQIEAQLAKLTEDLHTDLAAFYVSDDIGQRIAEKQEAAAQIIDGLEVALQRHRFAAVLSSLMVDQDLVKDRISLVPSSIRITDVTSGAVAQRPAVANGDARAASAPARPGRPPRPGAAAPAPAAADDGVDANATHSKAADIRTMTAETFQAESSVEVWIEGLTQFRENSDLLEIFGLETQSVANLNAELTHGLRRVGVVDQIIAQLQTMNFGLTVDKRAEPAAIVCSERINTFISRLGADALPAAERPVVTLADGSTRPVFTAQSHADDADNLPPSPRPAAEELWTDWVFSLDAMFVANAKDTDAGEINIEQNLLLGNILAVLAGEEGAQQ